MKKLLSVNIFLYVMIAMTGAAVSEEVQTPESLKGGEIISAEEAKTLIDGKGAHFFDVRSAINFGRGHIPTAGSLPFKGKVRKIAEAVPSIESINLRKLPGDKNKAIAFYSHGATGWKSYAAARIAIEIGYKNVMWLRGGYEEWKMKGYPVKSGR